MGRGAKADIVHVVDFGFARPYIDPKTKQHVPRCENKKLSGTARYVSINTHLGILQSRRDDLEALGYVLLHLRRELPWKGLGTESNAGEHKFDKIMDKKMDTSIEKLCKGEAKEFQMYLKYCRALAYDAAPDYKHLVELWKGTARR
eukprot:3941726-Amphidinium_carterae.1